MVESRISLKPVLEGVRVSLHTCLNGVITTLKIQHIELV